VPRAERMFSFVPEKLGLREIVATTFAAQLYVLPWIAYTIGNFSVVSFLSNILVLPTVPLAMLFSFIAGVFSVKVIAFPAYVLLSYELWIAEVLSKVPAASINIPTFPIWLIILLYLGIAYVTFSKRFSATSKFMFEKKSST
ncbi:MAG: ComEC/Rec2 family competence protein, partial [Candidatus Pacebacteria bacterium]|nr:ComEC/Rec2 family competence protein [Candidatus Paceibacterota bacterium]